jgi:hypothetical protein
MSDLTRAPTRNEWADIADEASARITELEQENARLKSEREAVRATALDEAAKHNYDKFQDPIVYLASDAIRALANMPQGYSVVKTKELLLNLATISGAIGYLRASSPQGKDEAENGMKAVRAIVSMINDGIGCDVLYHA